VQVEEQGYCRYSPLTAGLPDRIQIIWAPVVIGEAKIWDVDHDGFVRKGSKVVENI
jgi:hypothetical protein